MTGTHYKDLYDRMNDRIEQGNFNALSDMAGGIKQLSDQWNAQRSHTLFSSSNSKEYTNMEKAYKDFVKAFNEVVDGKSITDGKAEEGRVADRDLKKLHELEKKMQDAADAYISAKHAQKKGGIEQHSNKQGQDRLAMADILSEFKMDTLMQEYVKKAKEPEMKQDQPDNINEMADDLNKASGSNQAENNNQAENQNVAKAPEKKKNSNESIRAVKLSDLEAEEKGTRKANARAELEKRKQHLTRQRTDGSKVADVRAKNALRK